MNHYGKKYWQKRPQTLETSFQRKRMTWWMSKVNIYTIIFEQQQANFSRGYLWPSFKDTAKLHWLVLLDESLWQEFLTKETKEFKDSVSTISTVKDDMVKRQDATEIGDSPSTEKDDIMKEQGKHLYNYFWATTSKFFPWLLVTQFWRHC